MTSQTARTTIQAATIASLGTLTESGHPFVSLVTVKSTNPTALVMLISELAKHTQNLKRDPLCSLLLLDREGNSADPLAGSRVTILATAKRLSREEDSSDRAVFLEQHPEAKMYADFEDFAFYRAKITEAHLVAGFGRIETLSAAQLRE